MKFPNSNSVAAQLRFLNRAIRKPEQVVLYCYDTGRKASWVVVVEGPISYTHTKCTSFADLPGPDSKGRPIRFDSKKLAKELVQHCKQQWFRSHY